MSPPTLKFFSIPAPPSTTNAPLVGSIRTVTGGLSNDPCSIASGASVSSEIFTAPLNSVGKRETS